MSAGEFAGLVAVVTGGASGIGLAAAQELARRGARVAIIDRSVEGAPEDLFAVEGDVTDRASVGAAIERIGGELGGIDVVVRLDGADRADARVVHDDAEWARVFDVNVIGMARVSAAALPWLRRSSSAAIVNVCSIAALNGLPERALYSASKGAVLALTFAMATDHVREGVRVNCVSPGTVATAFVDRMLQNFPDPVAERAALDARQATGRMVDPAEVAAAIAYLASPLSGSTTGTSLDVDGGVTHLRVRPKS